MERVKSRFEIQYVPVGDLRPDPFNPRRMPDEEMEALTRSIQEFGLVDPLIVCREDHSVVGGHQRLLAARRLGYADVPVVYVDVTPEQAKVLALALNKIGGSWDDELLARLFQELEAASADLSLTGFAEEEIAGFLKSLERREKRERPETFDLEAALREAHRVEPRSKMGDLYHLGEQRLLCGDAGVREDVARVMGKDTADLVFTDPPYGIRYEPNESSSTTRANSGRRFEGIVGDDEPQELITSAWANMVSVSREGTVFYVCAGTPIVPLLHRLFSETTGREPTIIVWGKNTFSLSRRDFHPQCEFLLYGWLGKRHCWKGGRKESDLWLEDRDPVWSYTHPTQKPLGLVERAMRNSSEEGDVVLDPFVGSGTTLIACERLGRRCRAVEVDPYYVDVAVSRWEHFTGEKAVLEARGDYQ